MCTVNVVEEGEKVRHGTLAQREGKRERERELESVCLREREKGGKILP